AAFCLFGLNIIGPNEVRVAQFFGTPLGVYDKQGFSWCNPLIGMTKYSYKIRNFETDELKINDKGGSPINVAAVIRWHVINPEKAEYELENYLEFLGIQVEGNLRNVIRSYPYDSGTCEEGKQTETTLSHSTEEVTAEILQTINKDIMPFGLKAVDVSFNSLAYAPEIAAVMTQRQQAKAVVEAKRELSEGVVKVVESTIEKLKKSEKLKLSNDDESRLATNLTLLLCSHKEAEPVINIDN
ncbi:SPFH domain-containing protein, partial [Vibrio owensii]